MLCCVGNTNRNVKGRCTVKDLRQSFSLHKGPYRQSFSLHEGPSSEFLVSCALVILFFKFRRATVHY